MYIIWLAMPNQETQYHVADRVATITLNRPDKLNAWTTIMEREVRAAMAEADKDEDVRVIVLTGAGRGFCAGADVSLLSSIADKGVDEARRAQALEPLATSETSGRKDFQKKYSYFQNSKSLLILILSRPTERGARDRHDAGRDAMDAEGAEDVRHRMRMAKLCGPDASMVGVKPA